MTTDLQTQEFSFDGTQIRVIQDEAYEPWFVLADVCRVLGLSRTSVVADRIPSQLKGVCQTDTLGGPQTMTTVSEAGFYRVVLRSDSPKAEPFIQWVTQEVLPTIRRHNAYLGPQLIEQLLNDPDTIIRLATELKNERATRKTLEQELAILRATDHDWKTTYQQRHAVERVTRNILKICIKHGGTISRRDLNHTLPNRDRHIAFYEALPLLLATCRLRDCLVGQSTVYQIGDLL